MADTGAKPVRPKLRKKLRHHSFEEFLSGDHSDSACVCSGGEAITELGSMAVKEMPGLKPAALLEELFTVNEGAPVHGVWHHVVVGEALLVCLKNSRYQITDELIDEVIYRGRQIPGGACGFLGVCGALVSAASAYAILLSSTPTADRMRPKALALSGELHQRLAELGGSRCCKKSTYMALDLAQQAMARDRFYLAKEKLEGRCLFHQNNETCDGAACPYYP